MEDLLLPAAVAQLAGRTPDAVVDAVNRGALRAIRTTTGVRLITRSDAEEYAAKARARDAAKRPSTVAGA